MLTLLAQEFRNSSHWPKHVLVHYSWREVSEVDSVAGLYVLFLAGAARAATLRAASRSCACAQAWRCRRWRWAA